MSLPHTNFIASESLSVANPNRAFGDTNTVLFDRNSGYGTSAGRQPANLPRRDPKIAISGDEPSPLGKGIPPAKKPSEVSVFYADCNDGELQINTPASKTRPGAGPEPASIYHMLFQLYTLRSISSLSNSFRAWIQGRITWMENMTNDEDLTLLQNMVTDRPGDGYPIGEGG
jgi:hypothetical protein